MLRTHVLHVDPTAVWSSLATDLRSYVRRRVADDAVTDDLLQEIFVRIQERAGQLRDDSRIAPWVFRIARSIVVDHQRKSARDGVVELQDDRLGVRPEVDDEEDAEAESANLALARWLATMVETLEEPYAEAVRLVDLEGMSQTDAAAQLGLSYSGFKSRVQRGRAKLREVLDQCCAVAVDVRGGVIEIVPRGGCCEN